MIENLPSKFERGGIVEFLCSHRRSGRVGDASSMVAVKFSAQPIFSRKIGRTCGIDDSQGVRVRGCFGETAQVASFRRWRAPTITLYGHVSGEEDDNTGDDDDCEIWFDITQNDGDGDGLTYWQEVKERAPGEAAYGTDPTVFTADDVDGDGLDGFQEESLHSSPTLKDLFIELFYATGCEPSDEALNYVKSYYSELGINLHFDINGDTSGNIEMTEVATPNSPNYIIHPTTGEVKQLTPIFGCEYAVMNIIEYMMNLNRGYRDTHLCVFYFTDSFEFWNMADSGVGAMINLGRVEEAATNSGESTADAEKAILLHEIGHCIQVGLHDDTYNPWTEEYCTNTQCIMAPVMSNLATIVQANGDIHYCDDCWNSHRLTELWSTPSANTFIFEPIWTTFWNA